MDIVDYSFKIVDNVNMDAAAAADRWEKLTKYVLNPTVPHVVHRDFYDANFKRKFALGSWCLDVLISCHITTL